MIHWRSEGGKDGEAGRVDGRKGQRGAPIHVLCLLSSYIPVLMAQAKIYWDMENYGQVEKVCRAVLACGGGEWGWCSLLVMLPILQIFRKSVEFCNEHDVWRLNVAHVLFMQVSCRLLHTYT